MEEVKYMRGEEDRVNARNQENLVRNKTCSLTHTWEILHVQCCSSYFALYLQRHCLRHICLFFAYTVRTNRMQHTRVPTCLECGRGKFWQIFPLCHRLSYLDTHITRQKFIFLCSYMHIFLYSYTYLNILKRLD